MIKKEESEKTVNELSTSNSEKYWNKNKQFSTIYINLEKSNSDR